MGETFESRRSWIPLAPWGWKQLHILGWPLASAIVFLIWLGGMWPWVAIVPAGLLALVIFFFRDPFRKIPSDPAVFVAPADGKVVEISRLPRYDFLDGPAIRIGVFLSLFDVHVNRAPYGGRVLATDYQPGKFLNAMSERSIDNNEFLWIGFEEPEPPGRKFAVRQVAGLVARRIVCDLRPGMTVRRGARFGMIKFGSRTELILPAEDVTVRVQLGDRVRGGSTILAAWNKPLP